MKLLSQTNECLGWTSKNNAQSITQESLNVDEAKSSVLVLAWYKQIK